jgi:RNA polymerase sigma-70 factor (ECF subfamily)
MTLMWQGSAAADALEEPAVATDHEVLTPADAEDAETNELIAQAQAGDRTAFELIYMRYFDRVYAYARVALRDTHEAEDVTQHVFANVYQALHRYEVREGSSFRSWLFTITRNSVLRAVSQNGRLRVEEPSQLDRRVERPSPTALSELDWLSDGDLAMMVERLPLSQRQVILLRYVFEFPTEEIAKAIGRSPMAVRMLEHRAMRALEARLAALRDKPARSTRSPMHARPRSLPVTHSRRLALDPVLARVGALRVTNGRRMALESARIASLSSQLRPAAQWNR